MPRISGPIHPLQRALNDRKLAADAAYTYGQAIDRGTLEPLSGERLASLKKRFKGQPGFDITSPLTPEVTTRAFVLRNRVYVSERPNRSGAHARWFDAGKLTAPLRKGSEGSKRAAPPSLEASRVQQIEVKKRVALALAREAAGGAAGTRLSPFQIGKLEGAIARLGLRAIDVTPAGLLGRSDLAFVVEGEVYLQRAAVRPGAPKSWLDLGPLASSSKA